MNTSLRTFFICVLTILPISYSNAQSNKCPYEYVFLRSIANSNKNREYFSFRVQVQENIRLAYGTFGDLELYYQKYKDSKYRTYSGVDIAYELNRGLLLKSPVPYDSLTFLGFASASQIKETEMIAKKGEKYFVNYYFNKYGGIKKEFDGYEAAIMKYLQLWCIAAAQDDESGYMHISYKFSQLVR